MSIDTRTQRGRARGTVPLSPADPQRRHAVGYEFGCPGANCHLSLRFRGQPATGIDGRTFPAAQWEQSPKFTLPNHSIELAGVLDLQHKAPFLTRPSPTPERAEMDRGRWRQALSTHMNVTAEWFVLHDTGGGDVPTSVRAAQGADGGVHMFLSREKIFTHWDFNGAHGGATRFERAHHEFRPKFIHVELAYPPTPAEIAEAAAARREHRNPRGLADPHPPPPPGGYNFEELALAYIFASYRARQWLTVTCHLEVDRGIPGAHHDPRGFSFSRFYQTIAACVPGVPAGSTFGILDSRIGDNQNQASYANTFPAQYGPVLNKTQIRATGR